MATIIGHENTRAVLRQMLERGRLPHALLFCGPKSVGKRAVAQDFARILFERAESPENTALLIQNGSFPDLHIVFPEPGKKDISVETIRELRDHVRLKPYYAGCKVAIIDDADRMSAAASNSLLMTLEEPPANTYLILVSSAPHRLPATILSRCTAVNFSYLTTSEVEQVCAKLGKRADIPSEALSVLAQASDGSLALADLDRFIDQQTLQISDPDALSEQVSNLAREIRAVERRLQDLKFGESSLLKQ